MLSKHATGDVLILAVVIAGPCYDLYRGNIIYHSIEIIAGIAIMPHDKDPNGVASPTNQHDVIQSSK
jgi:hypothetical protein